MEESGCVVRAASTDSDVVAACAVDKEVWGGIFPGTHDMLDSRRRVFPECGLVLALRNELCVGFLSAQRVMREDVVSSQDKSWNALTSNGTIKDTHVPDGDWLYGVGLAVTSAGSACGASASLIGYVAEYAVSNNIEGAMLAARIPGYSRCASTLSAEQYVMQRRRGKPIDPELRIYASFGLVVGTPPIVIERYMGVDTDPASCDYGVLVEWLNPNL